MLDASSLGGLLISRSTADCGGVLQEVEKKHQARTLIVCGRGRGLGLLSLLPNAAVSGGKGLE